jgi:hypothetical protein
MTFGVATITLVAAAGVFGSSRPGSGPAARMDSSAVQPLGAASPAERGAPSHAEELLNEFFGRQWAVGDSSAVQYRLKIIIATLPDPYESHLDYVHDANLEAIRRAFESSAFVIDRFWLPTSRDTVKQARGKDTVRLALREVEPGAILFRNTNSDTLELRLLLLVPELPTRGVYKAALFEALRLRSRILANQERRLISDSADAVRIVGPSFSGSSLSMQLVLRSWLATAEGRGRVVDIVTGAATSPDNLRTLNRPEMGIRFRATINSDLSLETLRDSLLFGPLGLEPKEVALLRESSTQYGQALGDRADSMLVIPFPMSISSLRTEYQRTPSSGTDEKSVPGVKEAPRLPLDLLDPARPKEDLPVISRLSPPAVDLILDEVARTLVRRRIRMVGLLATDVRDKLFLGDEIRRRVPDVQFFTFESNVLYLRSDRNAALRGMLIFSTYPLLLQNQRGDSRGRVELRAFASDGAEGVYNATLIQLGNSNLMLDYRSRDSTSRRPSVWVTTVGDGTFLPVARMRVTGANAEYLFTCDSCSAPLVGNWGGIAFLPLATLLLMSLALLIAAINGMVGDGELYQRLKGETLNGETDTLAEGSIALHDRLYSALRLIAIGGAFQAASIPALRLFARWQFQNKIVLVLAALSACIGIFALATGIRSIIRMLRRYHSAGWKYVRHGPFVSDGARWNARVEFAARAAVGLFGVAYLAMSIWLTGDIVWLALQGTGASFWQFLQRASEIDGMVSPVLPLIVGGIGYAVWCTWHIHRLKLLKDRTTFEEACIPEANTPDVMRRTIGTALRDDLRRAARNMGLIRQRFFQVIPSVWSLTILVGFICLGGWLWPQFGRSLESIALGSDHLSSFDWLFRVTVIAMLFSIAWGAFRLLLIWGGLSEVLQDFARMPIIPAFERLPLKLARLTRLTLPGLGSRTSIGMVADLQWLHLQRIYQLRREQIQAALEAEHADVVRQLEVLMQGEPVRHVSLGISGRRALVERFRVLHGVLRELWRLEPMPEDMTALEQAFAKEGEKPEASNTISTTVRIRRTFTGATRVWLRAAEEYAATRMVEYTEWVVRGQRLLAGFLVLSLVLATLVISSYPYQPQSLLRVLLLIVLLGAVGILLLVLVQMNRDEVLSRIARTEPGRLTWDLNFVVHVVAFGAVPLLTLLSSEFPALRGLLFSWIQPLLQMLSRQ